MLARNLAPDIVSLCRKTVEHCPEAQELLEMLRSGECQVCFSYDPSGTVIDYEVFDEDFSVYHTLALDLSREARPIFPKEKRDFAFAILLYLYEKESAVTEEDLHRQYGEIYSRLNDVASLSPEKAKYRQEHQNEFDYLTNLIALASSKSAPAKVDTIQVSFEFEKSYYGDEYEVTVYCKAKKAIKVKDLRTLYSAVVQESKVALYGAMVLTMGPDSFKDNERQAIQLLSAKAGFSKWSSSFSKTNIAKANLPALFDALRGEQIKIDGRAKRIGVDPVVPALKVEDDGNFDFDLKLGKGSLILSGMSGYFIDDSDTILPILFDSEAKLKIYEFSMEHPHFQYDAFQSEIDNVILPILSGKVEVSPAYREKHPSRKRDIFYYVTYGEEDELRFSTEFHIGDEVVDRGAFESNQLGESRSYLFQDELAKLHIPMDGATRNQNEIAAFLKADLDALASKCKLMLSDNIANRKMAKVGKFNINSTSGIDWMEVSLSSPEYSVEEFSAILAGYRKKKKYVRIRGQFVSLSEEDDEYGLGKVVADFDLGGDESLDSPRLPIYQAFKLPGYETGFKIEYNEEIKNLIGEIKDYQSCEVPLSGDMYAKLRPYQVDGVKWLYSHARRKLPGILADEMGLGKTLQTIALLTTMTEEAPFLIVCPKSLIYNWQNEFALWNSGIEAYVLSGSKAERESILKQNCKRRCALIVSYDSLRNDFESYDGVHFSCIVLDEGQNIANVYAKKTKVVKALESTQKFVLTGTPIQNSLADLWSIFDFMMPGYFEAYKSFHDVYGTLGEGMEATRDLLMNKIAPFILKRTKKEVLKDLPPKEEQVITIAMNEEQRRIYDAYFQKQKFDRDNKDAGARFMILAALTRLREICVDPSMFLDGVESPSEKFEVAISMIKEAIAEGHKVLLFSTFAKSLFHLSDLLTKEGITSSIIYGDTPALDRIKMATDFNTKPEPKVMLVSLKAGGTGLNLVGADIVIHLDPWWNLAAENQASDRAHRIGQKRKVTIIKLVCKDTVEEKVIQLQEKKRELASVVTEGDEVLSKISLDDLWFLID